MIQAYIHDISHLKLRVQYQLVACDEDVKGSILSTEEFLVPVLPNHLPLMGASPIGQGLIGERKSPEIYAVARESSSEIMKTLCPDYILPPT